MQEINSNWRDPGEISEINGAKQLENLKQHSNRILADSLL